MVAATRQEVEAQINELKDLMVKEWFRPEEYGFVENQK